MQHNGSIRLAAVADIHCTKASQGQLQPLFARMTQEADAILLCGDLTDYGTPEEALILGQEVKAAAKAPVVAVFGNHDFESGKQDELKKILLEAGVHILDGDTFEFRGIGFAGVKGFFGGFGARTLQAWGEPITKQIVRETMDEALKLESALVRLKALQKIVLLHYSPILTTVEGEAADVVPFLGSSRLEEPLRRHAVRAVFHGHAHYGKPEGHTTDGVPVYNVALPLLKRIQPHRPPFRIVEVKVPHD